MERQSLFLLLLLLIVFLTGACRQQAAEPKRVFYLNSYHAGYGSSDDVMQGIKKTLDGQPVELEVFFMDTKRKPAEAAIQLKAREALARIGEFNPAVIIPSDDDAVKYVIEPYLKEGPVPGVFCRVNRTAEQYGLPAYNVTGMLEVLPLRASLQILRQYYPDMQKVFVLLENSTSEIKNKDFLDSLYRNEGLTPEYALVSDFGEWKEQFSRANREADVIYLPTNGAIKGWDQAETQAFVAEYIRKPMFTTDDFMMPYAVFGRTKVAVEQGEWAARTALEILKGTSPAAIPITRNHQSKVWVNPELAQAIGFRPGIKLLREAEQVEV